MKIKDISIGDIVLITEGVVKIHSIGWDLRDSRCIGVEGKCFRIYKSDEDIEPMPIYVAWLMNNGFKQIGEQFAYMYKEGETSIRIDTALNGSYSVLACRKPNKPDESVIKMDIRFAHELQHIMKLFKLRKEMEI